MTILLPTNDDYGSRGLLGSGFDDPATLGLLGIAASMLQNSGQRGVGFGHALGAGLQGGLQGLMMGKRAQMDRRERDDKLRTLPAGLFTGGNLTWTRR